MVAPGAGAGQGHGRRLAAIVANPFSGVGPNRRRVERLVTALAGQAIEVRVIWDPDERRTLLRDPAFAGRCRVVVAAGGDGTVGDVINDNPAGIPLAVLPIGNENVFARALGFASDAAALARAVAAGRVRRLDLGRAGSRLWGLMVSAGIDAEVVRRVARWRSAAGSPRRVTRLHYAACALAALARYQYPPLEVEADGRRARGALCVVFNVGGYPLGFPLAPPGAADDGVLDWLVLERPGTAALAVYAAAMLGRRHLRRPDVDHGRASRLRIGGEAGVPVQIDGEAWGTTPVDLEVVPQALTVVAV